MRILIALALSAIAVAMTLGYGVLTRPILADDQLYFYMTERSASGVAPHVSQLEVKTQLPSLIGGASIAAGRVLGVSDVHAGRFATVTAAALSAILGWLLSTALTGSMRAGLVGGAATLSIYGLFMEASTGFQPKVYLVAFLLAAHLWCATRRTFLSGAAAACALLCWQPGALVLAACGFATLIDRRATWMSVLRFIAGAAVVFGAYEGWFAYKGAFDAQIHQEWVLATEVGEAHKAIDWGESFWFLVTEAQTFRKRPDGLPAVFLAVSALMWLGLVLRPRRSWNSIRERPGLVAFWIAAHIAVAFTLFDHQAHPDMLLVQPYFAIACALGYGWLESVVMRIPRGSVVATLLATVFVALGLRDARLDVAHGVGGRFGLDRQLQLGRLTSLYFDHRGSVWVLGSVHLLGFSHANNWVPVGNVGHETRELDMKTYRPLRDGRMPEIIICGRGLRPGFNTWLPAEYVDITPQAFAVDRIRVYSRRSPDQPGFEKATAPKAARGPTPPVRRPPPLPTPSAAAMVGPTAGSIPQKK